MLVICVQLKTVDKWFPLCLSASFTENPSFPALHVVFGLSLERFVEFVGTDLCDEPLRFDISRQEVLAQAAADRAQRAAARQRDEAALKLQAWRRGCIAAHAAGAAQLQAFDARLQGVARV